MERVSLKNLNALNFPKLELAQILRLNHNDNERSFAIIVYQHD